MDLLDPLPMTLVDSLMFMEVDIVQGMINSLFGGRGPKDFLLSSCKGLIERLSLDPMIT